MNQPGRTVAIIVAAGSGTRVGGSIPKQYCIVAGKPMLAHSVERLSKELGAQNVLVVIAPEHIDYAKAAIPAFPASQYVHGGATRRESVRNGLLALASNAPIHVIIHDAARPFVPSSIVQALTAKLDDNEGAVPALPVVDSLARGEGSMGQTVDRADLWRIQTPQAFRYGDLLAAHDVWADIMEPTDDARMVTANGGTVGLVPGDEALAKITFADELARMGQTQHNLRVRTGSGYDVHRLEAGEDLWLCGVHVEHSHGLAGHSDADVAIHALVDAVLGAASAGDIGDHFPPSDPQWRGAASDTFLAHAMQIARAKGLELSHADVTIICEAPKIGPHKTAMRARLAEIMQTDIENISVKATTTERLGFTGRSEGIAAQAVATFLGLN